MDVLRRNTDYALRAMVHLARQPGGTWLSARRIADEQGIAYALTCKLLQRLQKAGLVESSLGARGGFRLSRLPTDVSLRAVIETVQGPVSLSRCLLGVDTCCKFGTCPIRRELGGLQQGITEYLDRTTLGDLLGART